MKQIILIVVAFAFSGSLQAQTLSEWTRQKKTQIKYLLEQIVAFQTYTGYLKKGYSIAGKGLSNIQHSKDGDWSLHKDFFGSLKAVNPSVKSYAKVADVINMQLWILKRSQALISQCRQDKQFAVAETDYLQKVCNDLYSECLKEVDELIMVITNGELQMTDDERISRIEKIYAEMQDNLVFIQSFGSSVTLLSRQRLHEGYELLLSKKLNGIK